MSMSIKKAIEINTDLLGEMPQFSPDDRREAVKLGIEALKAWKKYRETGLYPPGYKLSGETKEE